MIPSKILAPILASVAFVAGAAVALPTLVAGEEPAPQREPLVLEEAAQTSEPQPTLKPRSRDDGGVGPRQGPATQPGDDSGRDDRDDRENGDDRGDVTDSDDDDGDDVEVVRPQPDDDDDDDEADDDGDDGDDD